ncbi:hypothetical protein BB559_005886 [Furculomyces boomerangus]|uniref:Uncharacterized protein n=2 Tax=Harpellales TaxID=61421 RepID=A0A2T9Y628_9FUNG|nr:hypothetical protein BB559_005886 [Furculomyces boomerangus]PVZ97164.1 hypothetical protein BB558_006895 [Smittium angustum]
MQNRNNITNPFFSNNTGFEQNQIPTNLSVEAVVKYISENNTLIDMFLALPRDMSVGNILHFVQIVKNSNLYISRLIHSFSEISNIQNQENYITEMMPNPTFYQRLQEDSESVKVKNRQNQESYINEMIPNHVFYSRLQDSESLKVKNGQKRTHVADKQITPEPKNKVINLNGIGIYNDVVELTKNTKENLENTSLYNEILSTSSKITSPVNNNNSKNVKSNINTNNTQNEVRNSRTKTKKTTKRRTKSTSDTKPVNSSLETTPPNMPINKPENTPKLFLENPEFINKNINTGVSNSKCENPLKTPTEILSTKKNKISDNPKVDVPSNTKKESTEYEIIEDNSINSLLGIFTLGTDYFVFNNR